MWLRLKPFALALSILFFAMVAMAGFSPSWAQQPVVVNIWDNASVLSQSDHQQLQQKAGELALKPEITHIDYITFAHNDESFNDTVLNHLKEQHPELLSPDQTQYADGHLIVAVGFSPRKVGVYCGDNVCATTGLRATYRIQQVSDSMVDDLRAGNYVTAFIAGTETAGDAAWVQSTDSTNSDTTSSYKAAPTLFPAHFIVMFLFVATFIIVIFVVIIKSQQPKTPTPEDLIEILPQSLPSLSSTDRQLQAVNSQLATPELRTEWAELKQQFEQLTHNQELVALQTLGAHASKKDLKAHAVFIREALATKEKVQVAQENIDILYRMEQGDITTRQEQLDNLATDISKISGLGTELFYGKEITAIDEQIYQLQSRVNSPTFISDYARIVHRYGEMIKKIQRWNFAGSTPTSLTSRHWRTGMGIGGFISYAALAEQTNSGGGHFSSSSGVSTSYSSSSSFSGGGGSTNW